MTDPMVDLGTTEPVRVLHVCGALAGGVGTVLLNYYRYIDRSQVQFDFLTHGEPDAAVRSEVESLGGSITVITPKATSLLENLRDTRTYINRSTPHDVVHVHTASPTSFLYLLAAKLAGKRVRIAHSHATSLESRPDSWQFRLHRALQPVLRWTATDCFACSIAAGRWLFGNVDNVKVVPNAINASRYAFDAADRERVRRELGLEGRFVIGHVGRFVDQKNHQFLVEVFREIAHREPRSALLLVGEGPLMGDVRRQVTGAGLRGSVHFLGARDDVPSILSALDVFLLPSNFEGLPLVLVETQASGLPSLASTEVTREIALTPLIQFESLSAGPQRWADRALDMAVPPGARRVGDEITEAGYELTAAAKRLAGFYLSSVGRKSHRSA